MCLSLHFSINSYYATTNSFILNRLSYLNSSLVPRPCVIRLYKDKVESLVSKVT